MKKYKPVKKWAVIFKRHPYEKDYTRYIFDTKEQCKIFIDAGGEEAEIIKILITPIYN